jgi:CubicO group peptidase (beta-lactamase class C family)
VGRLSHGRTLGQYWRETFGDPLGLDFWIGMPEDLLEAAATVFPAKPPIGSPPTEFLRALNDASSLTARSFASPRGLHSVASMNTPEARRASLPGFGGVGTVHSLGKFYALLAQGGELEGRRFFLPETIGWMETALTSGQDGVLRMETSFSAGFMKDPVASDGTKIRSLFGPSTKAFGQPGAGGSLAFADPENGLAFAYAMNQMEHGVLPTERALRLVKALYGQP